MLSPVSNSNSSSAYQPPAAAQVPKSCVFCSLIRSPSVKNNELSKLTHYRDEVFSEHLSIQLEHIKSYVISVAKKNIANCVSKITQKDQKILQPDERTKYSIACALLTVRGHENILKPLIEIMLNPQNEIFSNYVFGLINDTVRKTFFYFSNNSTNNATTILNQLFEQNSNINIRRIQDLSDCLISSIDPGCINPLNLDLIEFFMHITQAFRDIWQKLEHVIVNLLIKFLRFYQDVILIATDPVDRAPLTKAEFPLRSYSSTVNSISLRDPNNIVTINRALGLASSYEKFFPTFFSIAVTTNSLAKYAFKEVVRILHDPRSFQKMRSKFPSIYEQLNSLDMKNLSLFTILNVVQVMLPYPHLKEMLNYSNSFHQKSDLSYPPFLKRSTKFLDIDLILSDVIRTYLQSQDYDRIPNDQRSNFIQNILQKATDAGAKLNSSLHALLTDVFFVPNDIMNSPESIWMKFDKLTYPVVYIIENQKCDKLAATIIEMLLNRLKQGDFPNRKTESVRLWMLFYSKKHGINLLDHVMKIKSLDDKFKDEFMSINPEMSASRSSVVIPQQIINFNKKNYSLDSQNGLNAIIAANDEIMSIYAKSGNKWKEAMPSVKTVFDVLVPTSRKGIEPVLDMIDIHATAYCMSFNSFDTSIVLKFVNEHNLFSDFDDALKYTDLKYYNEALNKEISSNSLPSKYRRFLLNCYAFRSNAEILKNICDYCQLNLVSELADLNFLKVAPNYQFTFITQVFSICSSWSNDALNKLTMLLGGLINSPEDVNQISEAIIKNFELLPEVILFFLKNLMMSRVDPIYGNLMNKLEMANTVRVHNFCKEVRDRWISLGSSKINYQRSSLVSEVML